jgi:ubiquinone/menaquinone biosynthesis C-methylase UbiE
MNDPKKIVADGYNRVAGEYARLEEDGSWPRMRWLGKVLAKLDDGSSVLDLGCGTGVPAGTEIAKRHRLTGVDISEAQIILAQKRVPNGEFIHGDLASVNFADETFEAIVSFYSLEHLPRREHAGILSRMYRWLSPGGFILLSTEAEDADDVTGEWLGVPMFFSSFDHETLLGMIRAAGFKILESAFEVQTEDQRDIEYLWVLAQKPG